MTVDRIRDILSEISIESQIPSHYDTSFLGLFLSLAFTGSFSGLC